MLQPRGSAGAWSLELLAVSAGNLWYKWSRVCVVPDKLYDVELGCDTAKPVHSRADGAALVASLYATLYTAFATAYAATIRSTLLPAL